MALPTHWLLKVDFSTGADTVDLSVTYGATDAFGAVETQTLGADGTGFNNATYFPSGSTPEKDRRPDLGKAQYCGLEIASLVKTNSPGAMIRCGGTSPTGSGYVLHPGAHTGTVTFAKWISAVYTFLASNTASADVVGDRLTLQGKGTAIECYLNATLRISTTNAARTTGDPGLFIIQTLGSPQAKNLEAGNLAVLVDVSPRETAPYPLVLDAGKLAGTYTSEEFDLETESLRWWSVLVNSAETDVATTVGDLSAELVGGGEMRWRTWASREATEGSPGVDFDWKWPATEVGSVKVEDPDYRVCGRRGQFGQHTRALVESRFFLGGGWESYQRGPWTGLRNARKIQTRVTLERESEDFELAVTKIHHKVTN